MVDKAFEKSDPIRAFSAEITTQIREEIKPVNAITEYKKLRLAVLIFFSSAMHFIILRKRKTGGLSGFIESNDS